MALGQRQIEEEAAIGDGDVDRKGLEDLGSRHFHRSGIGVVERQQRDPARLDRVGVAGSLPGLVIIRILAGLPITDYDALRETRDLPFLMRRLEFSFPTPS